MKQIIFLEGESPTLITLNMIEYTGTYLKKTVLNMPEFWMCLMQYITSLYKLLSSYRDRGIQNTVKHLRWSVFQKRTMLEGRCATRNFSGGGRFVKLGHFDKHFIKNTRKRGPTRKHFLEIFLLGTRKTTFWIENLTQRWTQSGPFFPKSEHIFKFQKG